MREYAQLKQYAAWARLATQDRYYLMTGVVQACERGGEYVQDALRFIVTHNRVTAADLYRIGRAPPRLFHEELQVSLPR